MEGKAEVACAGFDFRVNNYIKISYDACTIVIEDVAVVDRSRFSRLICDRPC